TGANVRHRVDVPPRKCQVQIPRREPRAADFMAPLRVGRRLRIAALQTAIKAGAVEAPEAFKRLVLPVRGVTAQPVEAEASHGPQSLAIAGTEVPTPYVVQRQVLVSGDDAAATWQPQRSVSVALHQVAELPGVQALIKDRAGRRRADRIIDLDAPVVHGRG